MRTFKLKRLRQCAKCPWKESSDPHSIPNGYTEDLHRALSSTIAEPGVLPEPNHEMRIFACHDSPIGEEAHCVGWLINQLGPGNNLPLRIKMLACENLDRVQLDGPQHERFEDTLPARRDSTGKQ